MSNVITPNVINLLVYDKLKILNEKVHNIIILEGSREVEDGKRRLKYCENSQFITLGIVT